MRRYLFLLALVCSSNTALPQSILWQKCLGGTNGDEAFSVQQTYDGGYIVAGEARSNDGDVTGLHGTTYSDLWIVKLSATGSIQWQKSLGGSEREFCGSIQQTPDSGYIVAGTSFSLDGDVTGNHGGSDYWVVKLSPSGSIQWQKTYGGTSSEHANCIRSTADGGYILAGYSGSLDGDVSGHHGLSSKGDYWVVKLSVAGSIEWQRSLGGSEWDIANSVLQAFDGGYIVAGDAYSNDGDVSGNHGSNDYWVVKLSPFGSIEWQKSYGGSWSDEAFSVSQTSDSGYIVAGLSESHDGDISSYHGNDDSWVVKLSSSGIIQWQKCLGGTGSDDAHSIYQTTDGGFIICGTTNSTNGDVSGNHGGEDFWITKLSGSGHLQWQKCLGGSSLDQGKSICQTTDGGYIIAGYTVSNDGDVTGLHSFPTFGDFWVVKLSDNNAVEDVHVSNAIAIVPNPAAGSFTFQLSALGNEPVNVVVNNMLGIKVQEFTATTNQQQQVAMPVPPGIYFITATTQSGTKTASKIVVQ